MKIRRLFDLLRAFFALFYVPYGTLENHRRNVTADYDLERKLCNQLEVKGYVPENRPGMCIGAIVTDRIYPCDQSGTG